MLIRCYKTDLIPNVGKNVRDTGWFLHCLDGIKIWYDHSGKVCQYLKNLNIELTYNLGISLLVIYPSGMKKPMFIKNVHINVYNILIAVIFK